jgi:transcriptional regulator with XRE-family HTH domain
MDASTTALASAIGGRIKHERQARRWTLDQLASATGVSRRMLVSVEQGAVNPSIGTLVRLSDVLGIGLPALVESPQPDAVKVTRNGEGATLWSSEAGGRGVLVAGTAIPNAFELWDWLLSPGDHYRSEAHGTGTKELIQVREGRVTVTSGGDTVDLEVGDAVAFPGDAAHSYANPGSEPARFSLAVLEPTRGSATRSETLEGGGQR